MVNKYGFGWHKCREKCVPWCIVNDHLITNIWFKEHSQHLWTWKSPAGNFKNQIDYLNINKQFRNVILHSKIYQSSDRGINHIPVIWNLWVKLQKLNKLNVVNSNITNSTLIPFAVKNKYEILKQLEIKNGTSREKPKWLQQKKLSQRKENQKKKKREQVKCSI